MSKNNNKFGIGTLALILGLLPTLFTTQINGVSILTLLTEAMNISLPEYSFAAGLILSVPGAIIGWLKREDYGATAGAVICSLSAAFTIITAVSMMIA